MKSEPRIAYFRFYEELNDFLPPEKHKRTFLHRFSGQPAVKDVIEALGVPHTEVDLILVNGKSVGFDYLLQPGDRVAVYPVFESFDISGVSKVRKTPLRQTRFIADVHLGKLARRLRMLGFDTRYANHWDDPTLIDIALRERRIILTRDRGVLKHKRVTHGYWIRATRPDEQLREVIRRFHLKKSFKPFTRCMVCNGLLAAVKKEEISSQLPEKPRKTFNKFYRCQHCGKIYWEGSHVQRMMRYLAAIENELEQGR